MLTETQIPGSDDWWLLRLATELGLSFPRLKKLKRYREGDAPLPEELDPQIRQAYARFVGMAKLNFAEQLVVSTTGRQRCIGFRTAAPADGTGDLVADGLWKLNHMPVQFRDLLDDVGTYGKGFTITTGQQLGELGEVIPPTIIRASPWNTIASKNTLRPWITDAAIQVGHSLMHGADTITLMRPGYFRQAFRVTQTSTIPTDGSVWTPGSEWTWVGPPVLYGFTLENPVVEFSTPGGIGEFELHLPTLDRINKTILDRMTITAMQAFRQRGISPGKDQGSFPEFYPEGHPQAGQRINYDEVYQAGPASLWFLPADATVWESQVTDITPILKAVTDDLKLLAGASSTPIYVLSPEATGGSAEGANLARETNTTKVLDRRDRNTAALARTMSFAFQAIRDQLRADTTRLEPIWDAINYDSPLSRGNAAKAARDAGLSADTVAEKFAGLTPSEMAQEKQNRIDDAFTLALTAPPVPTD